MPHVLFPFSKQLLWCVSPQTPLTTELCVNGVIPDPDIIPEKTSTSPRSVVHPNHTRPCLLQLSKLSHFTTDASFRVVSRDRLSLCPKSACPTLLPHPVLALDFVRSRTSSLASSCVLVRCCRIFFVRCSRFAAKGSFDYCSSLFHML